MKYLLAAASAVVLLISLPRCDAVEEFELTLEQTLARARERAPEIAAARAVVEEANGRLVGASVILRDNPEIEAGAGARMVDGGELVEGTFGIRQSFELGGRRAARIAGANAGVTQARANGADVTRRVLRDAAIAFWTAVHAAEQQRLTAEAVTLAEQTEHIARRRFRLGDVGVLDVNLATATVARQRSELLAAHAVSDAALGALRVRLGIDADRPLAIRGELRQRQRYSLPELLERASDRPDLQALDAGIREAEADVRLGRALRWPNLGVGATYERDDGTNVAMGLITLTLPVFERGQGTRMEAMARQRRIEFELEASRRALGIEVEAAYAVYERRNQAAEELERGALPSLDENESLARRSYEAGQLNLVEALAIRREILDTKRQYLDRLREAVVAGVELEAIAGMLQ